MQVFSALRAHPLRTAALKRCVLLSVALLQPLASAAQSAGQGFYARGEYELALNELKWEALQGDRASQLLAGKMYLRGQGTEKDAVTAAYWFQEAAKQGSAEAQGHLAEMYLAGDGLPQDDVSAVYNARQAADQGYAPAQVLLGRLYLDGRGVEPDPQAALEWFEKAAVQGLAEGQYQLGQLLEGGEGVKKDMAGALKQYEAAAKQGYPAAIDALKRLGKLPSPPVAQPAPSPATSTQPERTPAPTQKKRVALLIANQDYEGEDLDLTGPINDVRLIADTLARSGFSVTVKTNLDLAGMNREVSSFLAGVDGNTVSLVYYSGHGVEIGGTNYLIPTDFVMTPNLTGSEAVARSVDIARLYSGMSADATGSLNITILDACRNNPFKTRGLKGVGDAPGGLKALSVPAGDGTIETFTAYAAASGQVARDGVQNSPYATALARQMGVPGQVLEAMFRNVRQDVARQTANAQVPTSYANISSEFIFTPAK